MARDTWELHRKQLDNMYEKWSSTPGKLGGDLGYVALVLKRLGDHIFAEEGQPSIAERQGEIMARLTELVSKPRFKPRDKVRTKCDGAAIGDDYIKKGATGTVTVSSGRGHICVQFDSCTRAGSGRPRVCREDQLELVPEKKKQVFWPLDLVGACDVATGFNLKQGRKYVILETDPFPRSRDGMVQIWDDSGYRNWFYADRFELVAPGPNHPKEDR